MKKQKKLTKAEKRIIIAKDVIKQIRSKFLIPYKGCYVSITNNYDPISSGTINAQEELKNIKSCRVCAKGSLLISKIAKFNSVFLDGKYDINTTFSQLNGNDRCINNLPEFTRRQLDLIELAFENFISSDDKTIFFSQKLANKARDFYAKYEDTEQRLIAICKNIIKNKGTFVL